MQALNSYLIQFYSIPTGSMYSVSAIVDGVIPISVRFYILLSVVGGIMSWPGADQKDYLDTIDIATVYLQRQLTPSKQPLRTYER